MVNIFIVVTLHTFGSFKLIDDDWLRWLKNLENRCGIDWLTSISWLGRIDVERYWKVFKKIGKVWKLWWKGVSHLLGVVCFVQSHKQARFLMKAKKLLAADMQTKQSKELKAELISFIAHLRGWRKNWSVQLGMRCHSSGGHRLRRHSHHRRRPHQWWHAVGVNSRMDWRVGEWENGMIG